MSKVYGRLAVRVALMCSCSLAACCGIAAEKDKDQVPMYVGPEAVFEAWRAARARSDGRTMYLCCAPMAKRRLLCEVTCACWMLEDRPAVREVLVAHGNGQKRVEKEMVERLSRRTGISVKDLTEEMFLREEQLMSDVIWDVVNSKAAFVGAAAKVLTSGTDEYGKLESVVVRADTASATVEKTVSHTRISRGGDRTVIKDRVVRDIRFRKCEGSWLIDVAP